MVVEKGDALCLPKGYKQTEVGVIPEDWEMKMLGEVVKVIGGGTPSTSNKSFWNGTINWFTPTEIGSNKYVSSSIRKISEAGYNNSSATLLPKGTILLTSRAGIGDVAILLKEATTNQGFQSLLASEKVYNEFLYYLILSKKGDLLRLASGSTFLEISPAKVKSIVVPLPPLPEQTAIANALSDMDALIAQTEKLIEKKKAIKQGVMQELLKPKEGWVRKRLGEVGKCLRGVSYNPETDLDLNENENNLSLLRSNNIQNGLIDQINFQFVKKKIVKEFQVIKDLDIIICMANGSKQLVGKAAIVNDLKSDSYTYGAFMGCFRVNSNYNPQFIFALMESKQYRDYIDVLLAGSSINNLNPGAIESMSFPIPERSIQDNIADLIGDLQKSIIMKQHQLQKLKHQKQGMMQALLTGKIRLV